MPPLSAVSSKRLLLPLFGISLFWLLYWQATFLYPGGSNIDCLSKGFSLTNNYWCDLMEKWARNGNLNPAQPIAVFAWVVLCFSLGFFWYSLPTLFDSSSTSQKIIQFSGVMSSLTGLFVFSDQHDLAINATSVFGGIALATTVFELKRRRHYRLFALGLLSFLLMAVNYFIFNTKAFIGSLPVTQKIGFVVCLSTFGLMSFEVYKKARK